MNYRIVCMMLVAGILLSTQAFAADIFWGGAGSISLSGNTATVTGSFNLLATTASMGTVSKVEFYVDGQLKRGDSVSPYWLFADGTKQTLPSGTHTIEAKVYWNTIVIYRETMTITVSGSTSSTTTAICTVQNFCQNGDVYKKNSDCSTTKIQDCSYSCSNGACVSAPSSCTISTFCQNGDVYKKNSDCSTTKIQDCSYSCSNGACVSAPSASATNLLRNPNFLSSLIYWEYHPGGYVTWSSEGKNEAGSLRFTPNWGGITEAYPQNSRYTVHPGDKVIYEGWFKAGPRGSNNCNVGTGLGWDIRKKYSDTIIFTMNGPATTNTYWTYIKTEYVVPCIGKLASSFSTWSVSSGTSGTCYGGARAGLNQYAASYLDGKPMPYDLTVVPWVHIWHTDTVKSANIDNLKFSIVPGAVKC